MLRELYYTPAHGTVRLRAEDTDTTLLVNGRRRAETMPGGMAPVVEPPIRPAQVAERSRFFDHRCLAEVEGWIWRLLRDHHGGQQEDGSVYEMTGDEITMDID